MALMSLIDSLMLLCWSIRCSLTNLLSNSRPTVGRGEASEEHDLIAKYCEHLHSQKTGPEKNLDVSEEKLDDTSFERQDLIQVDHG